MLKDNSQIIFFVALLRTLDTSLLSDLLAVCLRMLASLREFSHRKLTPRSFQGLELRLERLGRELARVLLQHALNKIEASSQPDPIQWEHRTHHPSERQSRTIETRLGTVEYCRWVYQNELLFVRDVVAMDLRLGLIGDRVSPALAHKLGRLAADLPQQPAIEQLAEQFNVHFSVDTYRRVVECLSYEVRYLHDKVAIEQLTRWIDKAAETQGNHEVLLLVGRDGVHVPMRGCWKEAGCATLAVYDRNRKRLGTIYLGEMPQSKQPELTKRLIDVIQGTFQASSKLTLKLRYVTDAGSLPCCFYRKVLSKMKHPVTGKILKWSWGVDFFHACEYISQLSDSLFGVGTKEKGYLSRYRAHMDYAKRRSGGDPIGSGVTEAGCKVIFNQRMKQSGMRWSKRGGQWIVDLRTACRSKLWPRIWDRYLTSFEQLPEINQAKPRKMPAAA